ncbi:MAG: TIGR00266 family protein, partial [Archaeoglobaceae archaeon]
LLKLEGSGDLFLSSFGGIEMIEVDGKLSVDTGHIVAFEDSLDFKVRGAGNLKATLLSGEGLVAEFNGKGKVWIQTRSISEFVGWLSSLLPSRLRK